MALSDDRGHLPCGTELDALVRQVTEHAAPADPAHQQDCAHCRRALERIRSVWHDVRGFAEQPVAVPGDLLRQVMSRVQSHAKHVSLPPQRRGSTSVSAALVGQVARRAAVEIDGVAFASALVAGAADGAVSVRVRMIITYGPRVSEELCVSRGGLDGLG
jgi:predicted anti-sigma-YlaC factor YlaD